VDSNFFQQKLCREEIREVDQIKHVQCWVW